jgi:putative salt-induced outer membrane protein YdiY
VLATFPSHPVSLPFSVSSPSDPHFPSRFALLTHLALFLALFYPCGSSAAELHLRNGDRITGELVQRVDGKIYFRSALAGELIVMESDGVVIDTVDTPVETLAGLPPEQKDKQSSAAASKPAVAKVAEKDSADALAAVKQPSSAPRKTHPSATSQSSTPPNPSRWKGKLEFGFYQQSGRLDSLNTSLRVDAEREKDRNHFKLNGRILYGEQTDKVITDRADASFRWRHQLSQRMFAQSVTSFLSDDVKKIDQNYEQNVGIGFALYKHDRHVINIGGGITGQFREALKIGTEFAALAEIFEDYTYRMNGRLTFLQDFLAQYSPASQNKYTIRNNTIVPIAGDVQNYRVRFNTTLQGRITDRISMNLRYEYEFDNTIVEGVGKSDQRVSSTLGYAF